MIGPRTPRMRRHARERCAEMGISTKVAKRIVQHPTLTYPARRSRDGRRVALSTAYPGYAVLYADWDDGNTWVLTVLFDTEVDYIRQGSSFVAVVPCDSATTNR